MIETILLIGWVLSGILPFMFLMLANTNEWWDKELIGVYAFAALLGPIAGLLCLIQHVLNNGDPDDPR